VEVLVWVCTTFVVSVPVRVEVGAVEVEVTVSVIFCVIASGVIVLMRLLVAVQSTVFVVYLVAGNRFHLISE
jgi:hypothetical protein